MFDCRRFLLSATILTATLLLSASARADVCFEEADGFLYGYWTNPMLQNSDGEWVAGNSNFKDDFLIKIVGEFRDANGERLLYVRTYAPGFSDPCENNVFRARDVFLFAIPRAIDYCITRVDGFTHPRRTRNYHPGSDAAYEPSNRLFVDRFDLEVLETIPDASGQDPYLVVMISTPDYRSDCGAALVRQSEITLLGE